MKNTRYYYVVVLLLLFATALSFLDRQILSISIIQIKNDLSIGDTEYGIINGGFLISYALMFTLGGVLIDKFGSRLGLGISVVFWSIATLLHAVSSNVFHFTAFRFLLGAGEGGCFPGAIKAVVEWVPKKRQALANGIAIGGSAVGSVVAVPLCAFILTQYDWRTLFVVSGLVGIAWGVIWFVVTRRTPPNVVAGERYSAKQVIGTVLRRKTTWVFILVRFLLDPIFYFYMFWIPKYLSDEKGFSMEWIGNLLWIPFFALGVANIFGGWLSDRIFASTGDVNKSRRYSLFVGALLTLPVLMVSSSSGTVWPIILMSTAFFAHGVWITNYITSIGDVCGRKLSSTVVGLSGTAGALAGLIINPLMGIIIENFSYTPLWIYAGLMYPVAFIVFITLMPKSNVQPCINNSSNS